MNGRSPGRTGRRPGTPDTRADVLRAARRRFATDGYDGATIRAIAGEAGVDPALVHHYFGTKRELFREAVAFPVDKQRLLETIDSGSDHDRARALAVFFLETWEAPDTGLQMLSLLRSALTHPDAATLLREFIGRELLAPVAAGLGLVGDRRRPILLAASQLVGIAVLRYGIRAEPLASVDRGELVELVTPVIEHHLFGDPLRPA